jgi:DNA (cytosine-5)-methyltransferase 1
MDMSFPHCDDKKSLRVAGLFAGIGGFERGLQRAGHHASVLCEIDPAAQAVLRDRFTRADLVDDVRSIDRLRNIDVLCAGFPCQDLSSVGQKRGMSGSQSSLVGAVFRILERSSIDFVLLENVRFMLHLGNGEAMRQITAKLEMLGYKWAYRVVNSQAFGLPQRRHRVFLLASRTNDPRAVLLSDDVPTTYTTPGRHAPVGFYWTEGTYAVGLAHDAIPPLKAGSTIGIPSPPAVLLPSGFVGTPALTDAERLQGFTKGWTEAAEDVSRSSTRWRLLGNAVSAPVAEWLGRRLSKPKIYDDSQDAPISGKWPDAGWSMGEGQGRFKSSASDHPVARRSESIADFLRQPMKPLSAKAVGGFLRRAGAGNLAFPPGFLSSLRRHRVKMDR